MVIAEAINPVIGALTEIIVCTYPSFDDNFRIEHFCTKYLKESCSLCSELHFSFKCFQNFALVCKISSTLSDCHSD